MKVFLTGATGCVGRNILEQLLLDEQYEVTVGVRVTSDITDLYDLNIDIITLDFYDYGQVQEVLEGFDAVIHVAGNVSHQEKDSLAQYYDNVAVTNNIANACVTNGVKKLVITSTGAVHPYHTYNYFECFSIKNNYVRTKRIAELEALRICKDASIQLVILRPILVLGKYDKNNYSTIFKAIANNKFLGKLAMPGSAEFCNAVDVAKAHVVALHYTGNEVFFTLRGIKVTWSYLSYCAYFELNGSIGDLYPVHTLPEKLLYPLALLSELVSKFTGKPAPVTRQLIQLLKPDSTEYNIGGDPYKALGYHTRNNLVYSMVSTQLHWLADNDLLYDH